MTLKVFLVINMLEPRAYLNGSTTGYKRQLLINAVTLRRQRDMYREVTEALPSRSQTSV